MKILDLLLQFSQSLKASENLLHGISTVIYLLQEHLGARNPMLLLHDGISQRFFIEVAPELTDEEKIYWNRIASESIPLSHFKILHEMVLTPEDLEYVQIPRFSNIQGKEVTIVLNPIYGAEKGVPIGIFCVWLPNRQDFDNKLKILRFFSQLVALSFEAHGFKGEHVYETEYQEDHMVLKDLIAKSPDMLRLAELVKKVAPSRATVLIRGESGTGKELIARSIHRNSLRSEHPFIGLNCAALSESVLESELFGHEKGAFPNAFRDRKGRFELADGGTLFLDEIGDTSLEFQTKLLRVLQEGQFQRIGSSKTHHVDVRIVCATNVDLEQSIRDGLFREDLYYRLNVVSLKIPPLRERKEDIPPLIEHFLHQLHEEYQRSVQVSQQTIDHLMNLSWPGNVRQLQNVIYSSFLTGTDDELDVSAAISTVEAISALARPEPSLISPTSSDTSGSDPVEQEEISAIEQALAKSKGVQIHAAEHLGVSLRQLRYRIKKYGITVRKIRG